MADIPQYVAPYSGPEIEEGLFRILSADMSAFAWQWINTDEDICDLDMVRETGCYVVLDYINGIPNHDFDFPFSFVVEEQNGILYQVAMVGPNCWYRYFVPEYEIWSDWTEKISYLIHKDTTPPEEYSDGTLWLKVPDGDMYEFVLKRYSDETGEWEDIWGKNYLSHGVYDPQGYNMDMYEYFKLSLKEQMGVLIPDGCDVIDELKYSEFYTKVAHTLQINDNYYFLINPEDILPGSSDITGNTFWIIWYKGTRFVKQIPGISVNVHQIERLDSGYVLIRTDLGEIYSSTDLTNWTNITNVVTTNEYLEGYTNAELEPYTHEEIETLAESKAEFPAIDYIFKAEDDRVWLFGANGNVYYMRDNDNFMLYGDRAIPEGYKVFKCVIWKGVIFTLGHTRNGSATTVYYISKDEGRSFITKNMPTARKWSQIYYTEDFLVFSTDIVDETINQTYYTIDPYLTIENIRVKTKTDLHTEFVKFEEAGNTHDIDNILWLPYTTDIGGAHVSDEGGILIEFYVEEYPRIQYIESRYESRIRTTYQHLKRYLYDKLKYYTHDQIKYLASKVVSVLEQIEFPGYIHGVIEESFGSIDEDHYGFIFKKENGTLGYQTLVFCTVYEALKSHINNWSIHLTAEEREVLFANVNKDEADEIINTYKEEITEHTENQSELIKVDERIEAANVIINLYNEHVNNSDIHVTPEMTTRWNNKADWNHRHFVDGKVKISTDDIIDGYFLPERLPLEARKIMTTVFTIDEMLALTRSRVRNGHIIRVFDPKTMDLTKMPSGRFFRVMDDTHLDKLQSYLEFTMSDDKYTLWFDTSVRSLPSGRDGYELEDVYNKDEVNDIVAFNSKLDYGFEYMATTDIARNLNGMNKISASADYIKSNASNYYSDMKPLNYDILNAEIPYDVNILDKDIFRYLNFTKIYGEETVFLEGGRYIDIHYIEALDKYFVWHQSSSDNTKVSCYMIDNIADFKSAAPEPIHECTVAPSVNLFASSRFVWGRLVALCGPDNKMVFYDTANHIVMNTLLYTFYNKKCVRYTMGNEDYPLVIIALDTDSRLHITKVNTTCYHVDDLTFSTQYTMLTPESLSYDNGLIIIDGTSENEDSVTINARVILTNMGRFTLSDDWFEIVDSYLGIKDKDDSVLGELDNAPDYILLLDTDYRINHQISEEMFAISITRDNTTSVFANIIAVTESTDFTKVESIAFSYGDEGVLQESRTELLSVSGSIGTNLDSMAITDNTNSIHYVVYSTDEMRDGTHMIHSAKFDTENGVKETKSVCPSSIPNVYKMSCLSDGTIMLLTRTGVYRKYYWEFISDIYDDTAEASNVEVIIPAAMDEYYSYLPNDGIKAKFVTNDGIFIPNVYEYLSGERSNYHFMKMYSTGNTVKYLSPNKNTAYSTFKAGFGEYNMDSKYREPIKVASDLSSNQIIVNDGDILTFSDISGEIEFVYDSQVINEVTVAGDSGTITVPSYKKFASLTCDKINGRYYYFLAYWGTDDVLQTIVVYHGNIVATYTGYFIYVSNGLAVIDTGNAPFFKAINQSVAIDAWDLTSGIMTSNLPSSGYVTSSNVIKLTEAYRVLLFKYSDYICAVSYYCDTTNGIYKVIGYTKFITSNITGIHDSNWDIGISEVDNPESGKHYMMYIVYYTKALVYASPLWSNTALELYKNDRHLLGSHGNSVYKNIDEAIASIEEVL